jgi:GrpB-like predicted nucleotidyltransferase (UPF0157 family)
MMTDAERLEIASYDRAWPRAFEEERERLASLVSAFVTGSIEHVGSTSVPGLSAKPIVDIQVGVAGLAESRPAFGSVESLGYRFAPVRTDVMHFFERRAPGEQAYNLQLIPYRSDCWNRRVAFRDYLRSNPEIAQEYAILKKQLAKDYPLDRAAYGDGKGPFIRRITERALNHLDHTDAV